MENTPIPQRPRRADRYRTPSEDAPVQEQQQLPVQQQIPVQQQMPIQQQIPVQQQMPIQQQTPAQQPVFPAWYQQQTGYYTQRPGEYSRVPSPTMQQPRSRVSTPAQQPFSPTATPMRRSQAAYAPSAPAPGRTAAPPAPQEENDPNRLPIWLTWSIVGLCLALLALCAAHFLMQAYLTTREQEWEDAYQATLANYHVVPQDDGSNAITYQALIERYAEAYNLQPAFVAAIIRNESSFRTDAESSVGARGLMQLMPDTAQWIAGKLDDDDYSFDHLYDPETNIRYGCWYLNYLSQLFRGDAILVSSAYHAGQTTVTRWLSDRSISADGLSIALDALPDGPTKQYAGRVTTSYGIYQALLYP